MRKRLAFVAFALALLPLFAGDARACSCRVPAPPCEAYWAASAVFVAEVVEISTESVREGEYKPQQKSIHMRVEQAFRGIDAAEVDVVTGSGGGDCGYAFQKGKRYLVYAYRQGEKPKLSTNICSRTREVSEAGEDLAYIRGLSDQPSGATLYGDVKRLNPGSQEMVPMRGARISIQGEGKAVEVTTDGKGQYRAAGLAAGSYTLKLLLPDGLRSGGAERKVELADKGCAEVSFWVEPDARISGTVFDAAGRPAAKVVLTLSRVDEDGRNGAVLL